MTEPTHRTLLDETLKEVLSGYRHDAETAPRLRQRIAELEAELANKPAWHESLAIVAVGLALTAFCAAITSGFISTILEVMEAMK